MKDTPTLSFSCPSAFSATLLTVGERSLKRRESILVDLICAVALGRLIIEGRQRRGLGKKGRLARAEGWGPSGILRSRTSISVLYVWSSSLRGISTCNLIVLVDKYSPRSEILDFPRERRQTVDRMELVLLCNYESLYNRFYSHIIRYYSHCVQFESLWLSGIFEVRLHNSVFTLIPILVR